MISFFQKRTPSMLVLGWISLASVVHGQEYPTKPIRIVTSEAGGGTDFVARVVAEGLTASLGKQVIVDNRAGKWLRIAEIVHKATPDATLSCKRQRSLVRTTLREPIYESIADFHQ